MSHEIPHLVSVTANRLPDSRIRFQISSLEAGGIVDVTMSPDLALMACKILMNSLANVGELEDDQKC